MLARTDSNHYVRAKEGDGLSLEEMRHRLPAIFADHPHESRSSRYVHIPTTDVLQGLIGAGFRPVMAQVQKARDPGKQSFAKHMLRFRQNTSLSPAEKQIGDTHFEVVLRNSHDGSSRYEFFAGLFRLYCLNGAVVDAGTVASVKVRHTGDRIAQLDEVISGAQRVVQEGPKVIERVRRWRTITLTPAEQGAFAESARTARFGDAEGKVDSPVEARHLLVPRRTMDVGDDLWTVFNRVQENCTKGGVHVNYRDPATGRRRVMNTREVRSIDGDVKLNRALWQLAESMEQLKAAA